PELGQAHAAQADLGDRARALLYRPGLVVLHYLAAALSLSGSRVQPEADWRICVAALRGGGRWEPVRRLGVRRVNRARLDGEPRSQERDRPRRRMYDARSTRGANEHGRGRSDDHRGGAFRLSDLD